MKQPEQTFPMFVPFRRPQRLATGDLDAKLAKRSIIVALVAVVISISAISLASNKFHEQERQLKSLSCDMAGHAVTPAPLSE